MRAFLEGSSPLTLNGTYLVELVIFVIMLGILARFVYPRIDAAMGQRQDLIRGQLEAAEKTQQDAEKRLEEAKAELDQARRQAQDVVTAAGQTGEQMRQELAKKAQEDAERLLERARGEIELARQQAIQGVRDEVADLVVNAAGRLLQAELDAQRHRALIDDAVRQVESLKN